MKLLVLRHGQTDWNVEKRVQGNTDVLLNNVGIKQAEEVRDTIDLEGVDFCISSPLKRAKQTADIICDGKIPVYEHELLKERGFGEYEGKLYDKNDVAKQWDLSMDDGYKGIETLEHLFNRADDFINKLDEKYYDKTILIVTHGGFLKALYYVINGFDKQTDLLDFFPENGVVYEFDVDTRRKKNSR